MEFHYLMQNSFDLDNNGNLLRFNYINRYTLTKNVIHKETGRIVKSNSLQIFGVILKAYYTYRRVSKNEKLSNEYFNPVKFSYTTPNSRPVYLITLIAIEDDGPVTVHLGTHNEAHRDILFQQYGFNASKEDMATVKKMMTNFDNFNYTDFEINVKIVAFLADTAAMLMDDTKVLQLINNVENIKETVNKINKEIISVDYTNFDKWVRDSENDWKVEAVREMAVAKVARAVAREMERKDIVSGTVAPQLWDISKIGGKRRKTRRKSKTHKRKSNKKMRRSRKSRRRHKKK